MNTEPRPLRLLIVEDDEDDYLLTRNLLMQSGQTFVMQRADRLESALAVLDNEPIDVVLLDLNVPDSQGLVTFARIHGHAPQVPVVLLTGLDDEATGIRAIQKGAQDYLFKGAVDQDGLARAIRYAIERKRTEAILGRYRDHLEELVQERTAELTATNAHLRGEIDERRRAEEELQAAVVGLEELIEAKTRFVSNVSHELRTPLASMYYATQNLLRGVMGDVPERIHTYLEMLNVDCERLSGTVNDILDLSRIEANKFVLKHASIPFARFARRTVRSLELQMAKKKLTNTFSADSGHAFVECDPQKMERVILNLVQNAIKYTPEGGAIDVSISVDSEKPGRILLRVVDDGIGIEQKFLDRISEPYFRIGEHVTGTGLGLALCREIVDLHEGNICFQSPPPGRERGTAVSLFLPVGVPPVVVVVDDEAAVRELLQAQLTRHGYAVTCCENAEEALDLVRLKRPDVMLVDLVMPSVDGLELVLKVKAEQELKSVAIVVVTGADLSQGQRELLRRFDVPVFRKPWQQEELVAKLDSVVMGGDERTRADVSGEMGGTEDESCRETANSDC